MARHSPINLRRDDFETAAEYISGYVRERKRPCLAVVRPDGMLHLYWNTSSDEAHSILKQANCIGAFKPTDRIEHIEDEVLHWLRQQPVGASHGRSTDMR